MFTISLPTTVKVGDTVDCRINGAAARVTWRDTDTLVIEPGDARQIISLGRDRNLIHFTCGAAGLGKDDYVRNGPICYVKPNKKAREYYWLATNGSSVAACPVPATSDEIDTACTPTPQQLFGFPTREEQLAAQKFLLTAPMPHVKGRMEGWKFRVVQGDMAYVEPTDPEPQTDGATCWTFSPQMKRGR